MFYNTCLLFFSYFLIRVFENDLNLYEKLKYIRIISYDDKNLKAKNFNVNIFNYVEPPMCNGICFGENGEAVNLTVVLIFLKKLIKY